MSCISNSIVEAIHLARVRHDVEGEVQRAAPGVSHFGITQLRVNADHAAAQYFGAAANGVSRLRKEGGAASEEHAIVRRKSVVIKVVLGIEDHPVVGAVLARQFLREWFGGYDERTNGDNPFMQSRGGFAGVAAGGDEDVARPQAATGGGELKAAAAVAGGVLDSGDASMVEELRARTPGGMSQAGNVARGVESGTDLVHQSAVVDGGADFTAQLAARHHPELMVEVAGDDFSGAAEGGKMSRLARDLEVAAAGEVAGDLLFFDDLLDAINGGERSSVHAPGGFQAVARDQLAYAHLHAGKDHAAVART